MNAPQSFDENIAADLIDRALNNPTSRAQLESQIADAKKQIEDSTKILSKLRVKANEKKAAQRNLKNATVVRDMIQLVLDMADGKVGEVGF